MTEHQRAIVLHNLNKLNAFSEMVEQKHDLAAAQKYAADGAYRSLTREGAIPARN